MVQSALMRVVVIAAKEAAGLTSNPPGFAFTWVEHLGAGLEALNTGGWDCLMVVWPFGRDVAQALPQVRDLCDETGLPLVLAAPATAEGGLADIVASEVFDGFVDLGWPEQLVAAAILSSVHRFRVGRNVVEIQRQVLHCAHDEFQSLRDLVFRDDLTKLYNLRYFREVLRQEHARCVQHHRSYTLVYLDVDGLKEVNSRYGHAAGSHVLGAVGKAIGATSRSCDFSFRVGGDEFATVAVETPKDGGRLLAERFCAAIRDQQIAFDQVSLRVTASAGVASYPDDGETGQDVLRQADTALFHAKANGKNRVVCHTAVA